MQSTLIRIAVGLLAFGLGVSATMLWIAYRTPGARKHKATSCFARTLSPPPPPAPLVDELPPPPPPAPPRFARAPISGGFINDKALSKPAPVYPSAAIVSEVSGIVLVQVLVDEDGKVVRAKALSGSHLLQEAAVDAAYEARFAPTRLAGEPVKVSGTLTYNFVLP